MMPAPYSRFGKEVSHTVNQLRAPFAQGVSESYAELIVKALEIAEAYNWMMPDDSPLPLPRFGDEPEQDDLAWGVGDIEVYYSHKSVDPAILVHNIRQEGDEYACRCGTRWDVSEGEEHP